MSTAPAPASLACAAKGLFSGDTRSTSASMAVFTSSAPKTSPMARKRSPQPTAGTPTHMADRTTRAAIPTWIRAFRCDLRVDRHPSNACPKAPQRLLERSVYGSGIPDWCLIVSPYLVLAGCALCEGSRSESATFLSCGIGCRGQIQGDEAPRERRAAQVLEIARGQHGRLGFSL